MDKFLKRKNSTFKPDPLKGYHPDDLIDFSWDETDRTTQDDQNSGDKKSKNSFIFAPFGGSLRVLYDVWFIAF
jgi:hypothetical protein